MKKKPFIAMVVGAIIMFVGLLAFKGTFVLSIALFCIGATTLSGGFIYSSEED